MLHITDGRPLAGARFRVGMNDVASTPSIAIFGAGGIGCMLAHGLVRGGHDPILIARGDRRRALDAEGITLIEKGETSSVAVSVAGDTAAVGPCDVVVLALKQHQIEAALPSIQPLVGPGTRVVPAINGIPWWYFDGQSGAHAGRRLDSLDPRGALAEAFPADRLIGCVVYIAAEPASPVLIESLGFRRLMLGRLDGRTDAVLDGFAAAMREADFKIVVEDDIRREVWMKLWGNIWANPLSVLTEAGMGEMYEDEALRAVGMDMMRDAGAVAGALGIEIPITPEKRLADAAVFGSFKTSMLQDFEAGRAIELDGIVGAVCEIGRQLDVATPTLDIIYALTRHRAARLGCYQSP